MRQTRAPACLPRAAAGARWCRLHELMLARMRVRTCRLHDRHAQAAIWQRRQRACEECRRQHLVHNGAGSIAGAAAGAAGAARCRQLGERVLHKHQPATRTLMLMRARSAAVRLLRPSLRSPSEEE